MAHETPRRRYLRFFRADPRRDVDEELAFHLAMRVDEYRNKGFSTDQAEHETMQRFGNLEQVRAECGALSLERVVRRERARRWDAIRQDARYAVRALIANRAFSIVVALTLALGIGANTAVFSVAYGVLLRPLPYTDADALVRLWSKNEPRNVEFFSVSPADYKVWRDQTAIFAATSAFERQHEGALTRGGESQAVDVTAVTPDIFPLLGAKARIGRTLTADDARAGAAVAVLSHDAWTARFGADSALVGGKLLIDGRQHVVVGVMPPRFFVPGTSAEVWTPLSLDGDSPDHANRYLRVLARLAPGVSPERALQQTKLVASRLADQFAATNRGWSVSMMPVPEMIVGRQFRRSVLVLLGVVGLVLVIACANAANLQLARAAVRRKEIAIRSALGASRGRIAGQLLAESALLGLAGGVLGLALATGGLALLRRFDTLIPRLEDVRLDAPVLLFTAAVAIASGILFGLLPAARASRADFGDVLKAGGRDGGSAVSEGVRSALVIAEITLSLILLVGAGLLMRSFVRLQQVELGFDARRLHVASVRAPASMSSEPLALERFLVELQHRGLELPGVRAVAAVNSAPFAGPNPGLTFVRVDQPVARELAPDADYRTVTPGYVRAMGIPLVRGRDLAETDRLGAPEVVLISATMARRYWPNDDPVGRRIRLGDVVRGDEMTIVGVVGDVRYQSLETPETRPMLYFSALARPPRAWQLVLRGGDAAALAPALRTLMASISPAEAPPTLVQMEELVFRATATPRFAVVLFGIFAGTALLLAVIGVYGVMSHLVRQRTREMGIRLALGASREAVVSLVVGKALRLTLVGVALGLAGALALTRLMSSLLFGVGARDPLTFVAIAALLMLSALLASVLPARRATRADPMLALKGE